MEQDVLVNCKVVDLAHKGFQDSRDILYVQYHQPHKNALTSWIKNYTNALNLPLNHAKKPRVDDAIYMQPGSRTDRNQRQQMPTQRVQLHSLNSTTCMAMNPFKQQIWRQGPKDVQVDPLKEDAAEDPIAFPLMWI